MKTEKTKTVGILRDTDTSALLNKNHDKLKAYKARKKVARAEKDKYQAMEQKLNSIMQKLDFLIEKLKEDTA